MKLKLIAEIFIFIIFGLILIQEINFTSPPPSRLKDYFISRGVGETGAINLVSSIYLSYRAFDTLGETIVLLLAVSGIVMLLEKKDTNR